MPLKLMGQVDRTIIFEEFNREGDKLSVLLKNEYEGNENGNNMDSFFKILKEKLFVYNFKEFLEKFKPKIYVQYVEGDKDVAFDVKYSLEKPDNFDPEYDKTIVIEEHEFWNTLINLYESKGRSNVSDFNFDFSSILEILTPKRDQERMRKIRDDLSYLFKEYKTLPKTDANRPRIAKKLKETLERLSETYEDPIKMLTLSISETTKQLEKLNVDNHNRIENSETKMIEEPKKKIMIAYDERGNIKTIPVEKNNENNLEKNTEDTKLIELIGKGFDQNAPKGIKDSSYVRDMVISTYGSRALSCIDIDIDELKEKNDIQLNTYKNIQEKFIGTVIYLAEKMLGVKTFFDHGTLDGTLDGGVLITNCKIRDIVEDVSINERFKEFLKNIREDYEEKFYFGIIPNVKYDYDSESEKNKEANNLEAIKSLIETLEDNRIVTFLNPCAYEKTSYKKMTLETVKNYRSFTKKIGNKKQIVFAYPNFTILPEGIGNIKLGKKYFQEEEIEDDFFGESILELEYILKFPGFYVDASYVACGLVIKVQNYKILEKMGFKVIKQMPGVRFDLEEKLDFSKMIFTKFNKESSFGISEELRENIDEDNFGFCFWREKNFENINIFKARTLAKNENTGSYSELYKTLVENFIQIYICAVNRNEDILGNAFKNWSRIKNENNINNIIRGDKEKITIEFLKDENIYNIYLKIGDSETNVKYKVSSI